MTLHPTRTILIGSLALIHLFSSPAGAQTRMQAVGVLGKAAPQPTSSFPLETFKNKIRERIKGTGPRDTLPNRVLGGESCVEASRSRAIEASYVIQSMQANGEFANCGARVGTRSGWNAGFGSLHTYTVVEIIALDGKVIHTVDADNYMGPIHISNHGRIDWDDPNSYLIDEIPARTWLEKLTVPANGDDVRSEKVLKQGEDYHLVASGVFQYDQGETGTQADAQHEENDDPKFVPRSFLSIDGITRKADKSYLEPHTYGYDIVGTGAPLILRIEDSGYDDNAGSLSIVLYNQ